MEEQQGDPVSPVGKPRGSQCSLGAELSNARKWREASGSCNPQLHVWNMLYGALRRGFHLIVSALAPHSLLSQAPLSLRLKCICLPQLLWTRWWGNGPGIVRGERKPDLEEESARDWPRSEQTMSGSLSWCAVIAGPSLLFCLACWHCHGLPLDPCVPEP